MTPTKLSEIGMNALKYLAALLMVSVLAACGGGGGSGGTPSGGSTSTSTTTTTTTTVTSATSTLPTITLDLVDAVGASTTSVGASTLVSAKAVLKDKDGVAITSRNVTFTGDASLIKISPASKVLTDSSGVATVQISAASLSAVGGGTLTASATINGVTVSVDKDFSVSPANLTLANLNVGSTALAAYGNRAVSVQALINGVPATSIPVQVSFTAGCGVVNPTSAVTDATGTAKTTYTANAANCAGTNVTVSASSVGVATPLSGNVSVSPVLATNLQFVSASPTLIYLQGSGGSTASQSLVSFKVVDSTGNPVQNQQVNLSLANADPAAGMSIDTLGNIAQVAKTTDALGIVTVAVFGGTVPTAVQVLAQLPAPLAAIQTSSATLTVASGRAVQSKASLALEFSSIDAFNIDGITSSVTFSFADRQGNPVPDGTEVNFVTESGVMIPPRCVVAGGSSRCTSTYRSSGTRPASGRASILAYVQGEEDFVDANFNNKYDLGEAFTDLGNAYRDDDESGAFTVGEFSVPRAGAVSCSGGENGRANTCDGIWGANEVRKEVVLVLATSQAALASGPTFFSNQIPNPSGAGTITNYFGITASVFDLNGNSMATGTTLSASKVSGVDSCTVTTTFPGTIPNRVGAQPVSIDLKDCRAGDRIRLIVTSTSNLQTAFTFSLP